LVVLAEKILVRRDGHDRAYAEQKLEDVGPDSAEQGHVLQEVDPRFWHDDTSGVAVIMIRGRPVCKESSTTLFSEISGA
jgi:hypothetical protein